jgi:alpha-tubulin suppressor-like RCC1 family protein
VRVGEETEWHDVSAGEAHTCARKNDGRIFCFGWNGAGQLGDGSLDDRTAPTATAPSLRFLSVSAGARHTCGLDVNRRLWCWGDNTDGQIGVGTTNGPVLQPTAIGAAGTWSAASLGISHSCALRVDGELFCWGANDRGALGDGTAWFVRPAALDLR